jgi:hypothetical protein
MALWIARDRDGYLYIHRRKPTLLKKTGIFESFTTSKNCWELPKQMLSEVTFENSPQRVKLISLGA